MIKQQSSRRHRKGYTVTEVEVEIPSKVKYVSLADVAKEHGVENLRVFYLSSKIERVIAGIGIGFTSSTDPKVCVEGRIRTETVNRDVLDGYKFIVDPLDPYYAYGEYYNADFETLSHEYPNDFYVMVGETRIPLRFVKDE